MPRVRVLFWNIQTLGDDNNGFRAFPFPRMQFVAAVATMVDADVLCIQELKVSGIANACLSELQYCLNTREAALNRAAHWYYDYIKGALSPGDGTPPPATKPFNTAADTVWDGGHHEGYAVFWRQNLAKFALTRSPPIQPPTAVGPSVNTQSAGTACIGAVGAMQVGGMAVPGGGIVVPPGPNSYVIPAGTSIAGGVAIGANQFAAGGFALGANTVIGPGGVTLSVATQGVNPIVIPGGYAFGADTLNLPNAGTVVVPPHIASLVLFGRTTNVLGVTTKSVYDISAAAANFAANATPIGWLEFTRSNKGAAERVLARRPAYLTIDVNAGGGAAGRLVPIIVYHAPASGQAAISGMQRAAYSQPMYQAYDTANAQWIDCNNAIIGGDFNVDCDGTNPYPFAAYTGAFGLGGGFGGGANATQLIDYPAGNYDPTDRRNKTIVAINQGFAGQGPPIYGANLDLYRKRPIDNIFYRGLANVLPVANGTLDLLSAVSGGGGGMAAVQPAALQSFANLPIMLGVMAAALAPVPPLVGPFNTLLDLQHGAFNFAFDWLNDTRQRRSAEFVRQFASDHLPVGIQFTM